MKRNGQGRPLHAWHKYLPSVGRAYIGRFPRHKVWTRTGIWTIRVTQLEMHAKSEHSEKKSSTNSEKKKCTGKPIFGSKKKFTPSLTRPGPLTLERLSQLASMPRASTKIPHFFLIPFYSMFYSFEVTHSMFFPDSSGTLLSFGCEAITASLLGSHPLVKA